MAWPSSQPNLVVFGCLDGKVCGVIGCDDDTIVIVIKLIWLFIRCESVISRPTSLKAFTLHQPAPFLVSQGFSADHFLLSSMSDSCNSPDGNAICTGHSDGTVMRFYFDDSDAGGSSAV